MSSRRENLNLNQIFDILYDGDQQRDIFMEPPDVQELTDEDSGNEDDETQRMMKHKEDQKI